MHGYQVKQNTIYVELKLCPSRFLDRKCIIFEANRCYYIMSQPPRVLEPELDYVVLDALLRRLLSLSVTDYYLRCEVQVI